MLWVLIRIASTPRRGDSNEYPQHMFLWRNKENYPSIIIKYPPYLFFWPSFSSRLPSILSPSQSMSMYRNSQRRRNGMLIFIHFVSTTGFILWNFQADLYVTMMFTSFTILFSVLLEPPLDKTNRMTCAVSED